MTSYTQLISNEELTRRLSALLKGSEKARIISAFVTLNAVHWFERTVQHNELVLVGRFTPNDFLTGASDLKAVKRALNLGYSVFMLPTLHAKIYEIDQDSIFTGSANFTSKGLSLCSTPNVESAVELPYTVESAKFIDKIISSSTTINIDMLDEMERLLEDVSKSDFELIDEWPEAFYAVNDELFLSDLPLGKPYENCSEYSNQPSLQFAQVESYLNSGSMNDAQTAFKKTKAFNWLMSCLKDAEDIGVRFGEITAKLHTAVEDDPSPYRREVKLIQVNLYLYIQLLASDLVEIYTPGKRSEFIRLKK